MERNFLYVTMLIESLLGTAFAFSMLKFLRFTVLILSPAIAVGIPYVINRYAVPQAYAELFDLSWLVQLKPLNIVMSPEFKTRLTSHPRQKVVEYAYFEPKSVFGTGASIPSIRRDGEILVEIYSASINPIDYQLHFVPFVRFLKPIMGYDFSGKVVAAPKNSKKFKVGDEIYGLSEYGSLCEYAVVREDTAYWKPEKLSHKEAAASVMAFKTSFEALVERCGLSQNKEYRVLITGGSGGCGSVGIQIAKFYGAHTTTMTSTPNIDFVKSMGADEVIDYTTEKNLTKAFGNEPYDIVYDTVGYDQEVFSPVLRKRSKFISIVKGPSKFTMRFHADNFEMLNRMVEKDKFEIKILKTFDLSETQMALDLLQTRRVTGKLVINTQG